MRISDWSSDVCSSDLRLERHLGHRFAVRAAEMRQHHHPGPLARQLVQGGQDAADAQVVGDPAVLHRDVEVDANQDRLAGHGDVIEGAEPGHSGVSCASAQSFAIATAVSAIRLEKRSEEHTSEIQSLMRNSYAVLC